MEGGVLITAKHCKHGMIYWWLPKPAEGQSLISKWKTGEGEFTLKVALPSPADVLQMEISEACNPFVGKEDEYLVSYSHRTPSSREQHGDLEIDDSEEQDSGDLDGQAFAGGGNRLLDDEEQIAAYNNYQLVCKALLQKNANSQPCPPAIVNGIKDLKVGEPMIVDLNVTWLFEEMRQMFILPQLHTLLQWHAETGTQAPEEDAKKFFPSIELVQGTVKVLSELVSSVVQRFDFANAVRDRYIPEELKLPGVGNSFEAMAQQLSDKRVWDKQILMALRNCHQETKTPCLVQLRRGGEARKGQAVVGKGEMRLRILLPAEGVVQFVENLVNTTLPANLTGEVEFPTPCLPSGMLNDPTTVRFTSWDGQQPLPIVDGPIVPGGVVVGVIRNINPNKEAHTGIDFVTARRPIHQETYDLCIRELQNP